MELLELKELWSLNIPYEEKARLYYEKVPHYIDEKGGYRPVDFEFRTRTPIYFREDGTLEVYDDYTIDTNRVIERVDGWKAPKPRKKGKYMYVNLSKDKKTYNRRLARIMLSTFLGPPPDLSYTADHIISEQKLNDSLPNLRWFHKSGQASNQTRPETLKSARIIVNELFPGDELTVKEWMHLYTKPDGTRYAHATFLNWARERQYGFSYKEYADLDKEEWKIVGDKSSDADHVEISDRCRVKVVKDQTEHVRTAEQLTLMGGYPSIQIDKITYSVHELVFQLWHPDLWAAKKPWEVVRHRRDEPLDFRPGNLKLGTRSANGIDAHDNGRYDGTQSARKPCAAYDGYVAIKKYKSQSDAARFLVKHVEEQGGELNFDAAFNGIRNNLDTNKEYKGFTWKSA